MREYNEDSREYWDNKWAFGEHQHEHVTLDGSDGEEEFDDDLLRRTTRAGHS